MSRELTNAERQLSEMWMAGEKTLTIALELNMAQSTVTTWRKRLGLEPRNANPTKHAPETLAQLRKLYEVDGKSCSEVAEVLRKGWTKNMVVGVVYRLGLNKPEVKKVKRQPAKPRVRNRKAVKSTTPTIPAQKLGVPFPVVSPEVADRARAAAASKGRKAANAFLIPANDDSIPLLSRRRFQCAWPVGNPTRPSEQLCCGQPVDPNGNKAVASYCGHHAGLAVARVLRGGAPDEKRYERAMRRWAA